MSPEVARSVMDHACMEVMEGEGEMQNIKAALRSVAASGDETLSCLRLSATKVTGPNRPCLGLSFSSRPQ